MKIKFKIFNLSVAFEKFLIKNNFLALETLKKFSFSSHIVVYSERRRKKSMMTSLNYSQNLLTMKEMPNLKNCLWNVSKLTFEYSMGTKLQYPLSLHSLLPQISQFSENFSLFFCWRCTVKSENWKMSEDAFNKKSHFKIFEIHCDMALIMRPLVLAYVPWLSTFKK